MKSTTSGTNPILILEQIPGSNVSEEPNTYGYETIRIWHTIIPGTAGIAE